MTAPLMPRATAVWLVENTTLTFRQIAEFCELHELEIQAIADGDVASNIIGVSPVDNNQLTIVEIRRCEADPRASLTPNEIERNVKLKNAKAKKMLSPSQRSDKPAAILWILKNCPEVIDSQICKIIGTTKPTIEAIRSGTHKDMANLRAKNPVAIGLCSEKDLDNAITISKNRNKPKVKAVKKAKKTSEKAERKTTAKKAAAKKEKTVKEPKVKKAAPKKEKAAKAKTEKKAAPKKEKAAKEKKPAVKKEKTVKKKPAKKAAEKTPAQKKAEK